MLDRQRIWSRTTFLIVVLMTISGSAFAQQLRERQLKSAYNFAPAHLPVEIVSIKINEKDIQPDEKIMGDDTWLQGLTFQFRNVSGRPVSYINVVLRFPTEKAVLGYFLNYGVDSSNGEKRRREHPLPIQPGQTVDLTLTKQKYPGFLFILDQGKVPHNFDVANYYIETVCFEDDPDLIWQGEHLRRRSASSVYTFDDVGLYTRPASQ